MTKFRQGRRKACHFFCGSLFLDCRRHTRAFPPTYIHVIVPYYSRNISYQFPPHPPIMFGNATASSMLSETPHPFYPIGVELVGYLANDKDTVTLLGIALAGLAVICSATWAIVSAVSPGLRTRDKLTILWFMSSRLLLPQTYSVQANACQ
jgi:hypothetical protein